METLQKQICGRMETVVAANSQRPIIDVVNELRQMLEHRDVAWPGFWISLSLETRQLLVASTQEALGSLFTQMLNFASVSADVRKAVRLSVVEHTLCVSFVPKQAVSIDDCGHFCPQETDDNAHLWDAEALRDLCRSQHWVLHTDYINDRCYCGVTFSRQAEISEAFCKFQAQEDDVMHRWRDYPVASMLIYIFSLWN